MNSRKTTKARGHRAALLAVFIVFASLLPSSRLHAAEPATKGGITVSPAFISLNLPPGLQEAKTIITLGNNYSTPVRLNAEWQSIDEVTGRLVPSGPLNPVLAKSLSISETDIAIAPQSTKQVTVVARNNEDLAPGGHYATLVFTEISSDSQKLGLQSALSVTVFLVKRDGARTSIDLTEFAAKGSLFVLPSKASLTIKNTGNVHVVPRAAVTIERHGDVVAKAVVNESSIPLLPGKQSTFNVTFTKFKRVFWPSRLQLRVVYRMDQSAEVQERVSYFWYVPWYWPFLVLAIVIALALLIRKFINKINGRRKQRAKHIKPVKKIAKPKGSNISISSVGISPSHTVPVAKSQTKSNDEPTSESDETKIPVKIGKKTAPIKTNKTKK